MRGIKVAKWHEVSCLAGRIRAQLPPGISPASEETVSRLFPRSPEPQAVYADSDGKRAVTFHILEKTLQESQIYAATLAVQKAVLCVYPESVRQCARTVDNGMGICGWFSFVTGREAYQWYHAMFVTPARGKMTLGSYHALGVEEENKKIFARILKGIQAVGMQEDEKQNVCNRK